VWRSVATEEAPKQSRLWRLPGTQVQLPSVHVGSPQARVRHSPCDLGTGRAPCPRRL